MVTGYYDHDICLCVHFSFDTGGGGIFCFVILNMPFALNAIHDTWTMHHDNT